MWDARNIVLLNIQHRAILYQHITIMNIQDSSFIITQFDTGKCIIRDSAIKHFTKLTLFPRVSKSLKANFGVTAAILREHLFEHRLFHIRQLFKLTLMKGDKVVKAS